MTPFLKWAGGKRWLFTKQFLESLPTFQRYIEPFLGGGAGFFSLNPERAILSDINPELINVYRQVRADPDGIEGSLARLHEMHSEVFYYEMRSVVPDDLLQRAARTLYLNRSCWNGLYRLNKKGEFNVPVGTKDQIRLETDDFKEASRRLQKTELNVADFEETLDRARPGDLVFLDPPYTVKHNLNGFVKYNEKIFSWSDQERLRDGAIQAADRGAKVIITNADHDSVRELYGGHPAISPVSRASVIAGKASARSRTTELVIRL